MALVAAVNGTFSDQLNVNQFINLFTGVMTDQPITFSALSGFQVVGTVGNINISNSGNNLNFTRPSTNYITATDAGGSFSIGAGNRTADLLISSSGAPYLTQIAADGAVGDLLRLVSTNGTNPRTIGLGPNIGGLALAFAIRDITAGRQLAQWDASGNTTLSGTLSISGGTLDVTPAQLLNIGATGATSITIGRAGQSVFFGGSNTNAVQIQPNTGIDTAGAGKIYLGRSLATQTWVGQGNASSRDTLILSSDAPRLYLGVVGAGNAPFKISAQDTIGNSLQFFSGTVNADPTASTWTELMRLSSSGTLSLLVSDATLTVGNFNISDGHKVFFGGANGAQSYSVGILAAEPTRTLSVNARMAGADMRFVTYDGGFSFRSGVVESTVMLVGTQGWIQVAAGQSLDTMTAGILYLGQTNANNIVLGRANAPIDHPGADTFTLNSTDGVGNALFRARSANTANDTAGVSFFKQGVVEWRWRTSPGVNNTTLSLQQNGSTDILSVSPSGALTVSSGTSLGQGTVTIGGALNETSALVFQNTGVNQWQFYRLANDTHFYFRDLVNSRMHITLTPGATATTSASDFNTNVNVSGILSSTNGLSLGSGYNGGLGIHADGANIYVEAASANQVIFRPTSGSGVNQSQFDGSGNLGVAGNLDKTAAGTFAIGGATATTVAIGKATGNVQFLTSISIPTGFGFDTQTANGQMNIGTINANDIRIGRAAANTQVLGAFGVGSVVSYAAVYAALSMNTSVAGLVSGVVVADGTVTYSNNNNTYRALETRNVTLATGTTTGTDFFAGRFDAASFSKTGTGSIANAYGLYVTAPTVATANTGIYAYSGGAGQPFIVDCSSASPWSMIMRRSDLGGSKDIQFFNNAGEFDIYFAGVLGMRLSAIGGPGFYGHTAPTQPAAPVTLADVIAIIRGCGLSA